MARPEPTRAARQGRHDKRDGEESAVFNCGEYSDSPRGSSLHHLESCLGVIQDQGEIGADGRWKIGVDAASWAGKCALGVNKTEITNTGEALSKAGGSL